MFLYTSSVLTPLESMNHFHADYIKCLSYVTHTNRAFSAGLDSNIYLWDLQQGIKVAQHFSFPRDKKKSIYCVDNDERGDVMVCGSAEGVLTVWDVRQDSHQKRVKLKG